VVADRLLTAQRQRVVVKVGVVADDGAQVGRR
jgi:hypothetical protein